ncbi:MAG: hypothetical protein ACRD82_02360 [Blastocatellia bacterium]
MNTTKRLAAIEAKAAKTITVNEFVFDVLAPVFRTAERCVSQARDLEAFKANVISGVASMLKLDPAELREVLQ